MREVTVTPFTHSWVHLIAIQFSATSIHIYIHLTCCMVEVCLREVERFVDGRIFNGTLCAATYQLHPPTSVCIKDTRHLLLLFSQIPSIDQLEMHFAMDSNLLHKESDEAARQLAKQEGHGEGEGEGVRVKV